MSKVLLWVGIVLGAIYIVKTQYLTSKTWTPFRDGCVAAGSSEARCSCLADYVHERFTDAQVAMMMNNSNRDPEFIHRVEQTVMAGTMACSAEG